MKYKIQEYLLEEREWIDSGYLNYTDNDSEIKVNIEVHNVIQSIIVKNDNDFYSLDVTDDVSTDDNLIQSKSKVHSSKRKFELVEHGKISKFTLPNDKAYYSKVFPLIFYKVEKKEIYNVFSNYVNKYFQIRIKYIGDSLQKFDNKAYQCNQYYCFGFDDNKSDGSYIYLDNDGMIAMVNNSTRIIRL